MELGMVGLGRMGGNMVARLRSAGHTVVGYDTNPDVSEVKTLADLVAGLTASPRVVWVMVPVQFLAALPYVATVVVLVLISRDRKVLQNNLPASLGKPFLP